jgi:hypothetical protein
LGGGRTSVHVGRLTDGQLDSTVEVGIEVVGGTPLVEEVLDVGLGRGWGGGDPARWGGGSAWG